MSLFTSRARFLDSLPSDRQVIDHLRREGVNDEESTFAHCVGVACRTARPLPSYADLGLSPPLLGDNI